MKYFKGISFICCGDCPQYASIQNRVFDGYYGIQYNHEGPMDFAVRDDPRRHVEVPCAFISQPRLKFYYGAPPGKTRHHVFVCFKGPRADKFIRDRLMVLDRRQPLIKIINPERFLYTFRELIAKVGNSNHQGDYDRAVLLLEDLLLQMHEQPMDKPEINSYFMPGLKKLKNALMQDPQLKWDFMRESSSLGISYPHFRRIFRQYTGISPMNYLIKCRLQVAERLLLYSGDQIRSISEKCGIADEFYFSRLFKKYYKLSPNTYRKEFKSLH